jgi:hypothetical protein
MLSLSLLRAPKSHLNFGPRLDAENKPKRTPSALHRRLCSRCIGPSTRRFSAVWSSLSPSRYLMELSPASYYGITGAGTSSPSERSNSTSYDRSGGLPSPLQSAMR